MNMNTLNVSEKHANYLFSNKDLVHLFLPLVIEQVLERMVGLADSMMVAQVGESAVSGVSLIDFVVALLISIFGALATGGAVLAGQYMGNKQIGEARRSANQLVWFVGAVAVGIMALVYLAKPLIMNVLFGQITVEVYNHANIYLMITGASIPFLALYSAGAAIFRTMGNSKLPMTVMLVMNILNVAGNAILVLGFKMGTAGIAIPTLVSRILAASIVLFFALNKKNELHLEKSFKPQYEAPIIKRILKVGLPFGIENGLFHFCRVLVLSLISTFGTASLAAYSVSGSIGIFTTILGLAINLGMTTIISRCVGLGDFDQTRYYHKKIIGIVFFVHFVMNSLLVILLPLILRIYNLSDEANVMTTHLVIWQAIFSVFVWPLGFVQPVTFRAAGDAKYPMIINIMSTFIMRIIMAYVLGGFLGMGVYGAYFAMFLDWILKAVLYTIHYLRKSWTRFRLI
jgi:putative MATE family efflux protein